MSNRVDHAAARETLAFPALEDSTARTARDQSPFWTRPQTYRRTTSINSSARTKPKTWHGKLLHRYRKLDRAAWKQVNRLTPLQRVAAVLVGVSALVLGILLLVYNERIFAALEPWAKKWRDLPGGWAILWAATVLVSFPPLIGYSTCVTLSGFVYGFPNGWFIVASATIIGSTISFLASRYVLRNFVDRLIKNDSRFAALALTLKHDGLKLLIMIRLCPLPYSLSNGGLATIPTVTWQSFMFATAIVSPKLLIHVFVGSKLADLAEKEMDPRTKAISYLSIAIGVLAGATTGFIIYNQTKKRAAELEEQEREGARSNSRDALRAEYADDPAGLEAAEILREEEDDISLRDAWDDDYGEDTEVSEDERQVRSSGSPYRDELSGDEDAREVGDVFDEADGPPERGGKK